MERPEDYGYEASAEILLCTLRQHEMVLRELLALRGIAFDQSDFAMGIRAGHS